MAFGSKKPVIGLDVGAAAVKAVKLSRNGERLEVSGLAMAEVRPKSSEQVDPEMAKRVAAADAITRVFAALGTEPARAGAIVTAIGGPGVSIKQLRFPKMKAQTFAEALQWEARKHVPFDPTDVVLDFQILDEDEDGDGEDAEMTVLLAAAKKGYMEQHLSALSEAGVEPHVVDLAPLALMNEADEEGLIDGGSIAIVEIGRDAATLSAYRRGSAFFARSILLYQAMMSGGQNGGGSDSHSRHGEGMALEGNADPATWLPHLLNEVSISLRFYDNETQKKGIDALYLAGGRALTPGITEAFESRLSIETKVMDPLAAFKGPVVESDELGVQGARFSLAMGLARRR